MKKLLVCVALMGLMATTATAEPFAQPIDRTNVEIITSVEATPLGAGAPRVYTPTPIYDRRPFSGSYFSFSGTGNVSADDYNLVGSTPGASYLMRDFYFVGGVAVPGQVAFFTFFDNTGLTQVGIFGVQLPYGGAYHWHITMSTPRPVANGGFVNMWADNGSVVTVSTGIWFLEPATAPPGPFPFVGTTGPSLPGATTGGVSLEHDFAIMIPEPASLALFGMGLLTLVVRRR